MFKKYILLSILFYSFSLYAAQETAEGVAVNEPIQALDAFFKDPQNVLSVREQTKQTIGGVEYSIDEVNTEAVPTADKHSTQTDYIFILSEKARVDEQQKGDSETVRQSKYARYDDVTITKTLQPHKASTQYNITPVGWLTTAAAATTACFYGYSWLRGGKTK
jgi:hypothetical protein